MMVKLYVLFALAAASLSVKAQDTTQHTSKFNILKATEIHSSIKVDGLLNEAAWAANDSAAHFIQVEPYQGNATKFPTVLKVLYNETHLYVGVVCYDSSGRKGIRVTELYRDF